MRVRMILRTLKLLAYAIRHGEMRAILRCAQRDLMYQKRERAR
jgi:hypothetical protein